MWITYRLSKRSIVVVITFLIFGFIFATLRYYVEFLETDFIINEKNITDAILSDNITKIICIIIFCLTIISFILNIIYKKVNHKNEEIKDISIAFLLGILFSFGLVESGMVKRNLVLLFLSIGEEWMQL